MTMRYLLFILLTLLVLSCKEKDVDPPEEILNEAPALQPGQVNLHYDGYNMDAPELEIGNYEVAAHFSAEETANLIGGKLVAVQYYMREKPTSAKINIYKGEMIADENRVYTANVLSQMNRLKWNMHQLSDTIFIDEEPIWIALEFTASSMQKYIGCDPGPAHIQGDWMWALSDQEWIRFETRTGTSINWNIRGVVEP